LVLSLTAPRPEPIEPIPQPPDPPDPETWWLDPAFRCSRAESSMARTAFLADAFPYFDTNIGPGSLGTFLGAEPHFAPTTVWYEPCIGDPDRYGPIRFVSEGNKWLRAHLALIEEGLCRSQGRYLVGMPDLIENIDTLAAMRGTERLLMDLMDRPAWVEARLAEINNAFFAAFSLIFDKVRDAEGGNVFSAYSLWGPGRTAKVQCDFSLMISPAMFRRIVVPPLTAQCEWLDYSMYHLDGTGGIKHLDALLAIQALDAVEWTPEPGQPSGGSPHWYDLYRRIKAGGKGIQAIGVKPDEVVPFLDAVGPEGLYVVVHARDMAEAEKLLKAAEPYRM
jgi:hypothetical protein